MKRLEKLIRELEREEEKKLKNCWRWFYWNKDTKWRGNRVKICNSKAIKARVESFKWGLILLITFWGTFNGVLKARGQTYEICITKRYLENIFLSFTFFEVSNNLLRSLLIVSFRPQGEGLGDYPKISLLMT